MPKKDIEGEVVEVIEEIVEIDGVKKKVRKKRIRKPKKVEEGIRETKEREELTKDIKKEEKEEKKECEEKEVVLIETESKEGEKRKKEKELSEEEQEKRKTKKKKVIKAILTGVVITSIGVGGVVAYKMYQEEQARIVYEEEKRKFLKNYTEEQVEYIEKSGIVDKLMAGDKSYDKYLKERFTTVENGEEGMLRDAYELGEYISIKRREGGLVVAEVVPTYIKEVYNTDVEVIGTKVKGDVVEVTVKDGKYGIEGVLLYNEKKGIATETYGLKLTSKILSEKIENSLKGKVPEGTKVMAWGNSAVTLRDKCSVNTLRSDTLEELEKRIEGVGNPVVGINVYIPVSEQFQLKYLEGAIKEIIKYGKVEEGKKTKINIFIVKGKEKIEKVLEKLHNNRDVYKDETVGIPEWCSSGGEFIEGTKGELKIDLEELIYGYIRIDDVSKFTTSFNYLNGENIIGEEIVENRGYLSRWYNDKVPNVESEAVIDIDMAEELEELEEIERAEKLRKSDEEMQKEIEEGVSGNLEAIESEPVEVENKEEIEEGVSGNLEAIESEPVEVENKEGIEEGVSDKLEAIESEPVENQGE